MWEKSKHRFAPNGGVMRTSVLGLHQWHDLEAVFKNAVEICKCTHYDPRFVSNNQSPFLVSEIFRSILRCLSETLGNFHNMAWINLGLHRYNTKHLAIEIVFYLFNLSNKCCCAQVLLTTKLPFLLLDELLKDIIFAFSVENLGLLHKPKHSLVTSLVRSQQSY